MRSHKILHIVMSFIVAYHLNSFASDITLKGNIFSTDSKPLAGANIDLVGAKIHAQTDSSGQFLLSGTAIHDPKPVFFSKSIIHGSVIRFTVPDPGEGVRVDIFNLNGKKLQTPFDKKLEKGVYEIRPLSMLSGAPAKGFYLIRISVGTTTQEFKMVNVSGISAACRTAIRQKPDDLGLRKAASAIVDTLLVSLNGYIDRRIEIDKYDQDLGTITIASIPDKTYGPNLGNDRLLILPIDSTVDRQVSIALDSTVDSISKTYDSDSLLAHPVRITFKNPENAIGKVLMKFPIKQFNYSNMNSITTFLEIQIGDYTIPIHGYFLKDTLVITLRGIDSGMVVAPVFNPDMRIEARFDTTDESLHKTKLVTDKEWPAQEFVVYFDWKAVHDFLNLAEVNTEKEVREYILKNVVDNANKIAKIYHEDCKFNYPDLEVVNKLGLSVSAKEAFGSTIPRPSLHMNSNHKWFPIIITPNGSSETSRKTEQIAGKQFLGMDRLKDLKPEDRRDGLGSIIASIAHEMMHAIIDGYDIYADDVQKTSYLYSGGIDEGIATAMGVTLDFVLGLSSNATTIGSIAKVRTVVENLVDKKDSVEVFMMNFPILEYRGCYYPQETNQYDNTNSKGECNSGYTHYPMYANQDFFAYVAKAFPEKDSHGLTYIAGFLKSLSDQCKTAMPTTPQQYLAYVNAYFKGRGLTGLGNVYADFIRNRVYEFNEASSLRDNDPLAPAVPSDGVQLRRDLIADPKGFTVANTNFQCLPQPAILHAATPNRVTFAEIPPYSTRIVKAFFNISIKKNKISRGCESPGLGEGKLMTVIYPEKTNKWLRDRTENKIENADVTFTTSDLDMATVLLINASSEVAKNVTVSLTEYPDDVPVYGCTAAGAMNYNATATVDDGSCIYLIPYLLKKKE